MDNATPTPFQVALGGKRDQLQKAEEQQETLDCYKIKPVFTGMRGSWLGIGTSLQSCWDGEKVTL